MKMLKEIILAGVVGLYSCGSEPGCQVDTDCKGERICSAGECVDDNGVDGRDDPVGNDNSCKNSPLNGTFPTIMDCVGGADTIANEDTCSFKLKSKSGNMYDVEYSDEGFVTTSRTGSKSHYKIARDFSNFDVWGNNCDNWFSSSEQRRMLGQYSCLVREIDSFLNSRGLEQVDIYFMYPDPRVHGDEDRCADPGFLGHLLITQYHDVWDGNGRYTNEEWVSNLFFW